MTTPEQIAAAVERLKTGHFNYYDVAIALEALAAGQEEIRGLKREYQRMDDCVTTLEKLMGKAAHETPYDAARRLREDTNRLDWLEEQKAGLNFADNPQGPHVWQRISPIEFDNGGCEKVLHSRGKTYRAAVDAAISAAAGGEG